MLRALDRAFEGTGVEPSILERYARHACLLLEENQRVNLTAIQEPDAVAVKHYLDVWKVLGFLELRDRDLLDLGSGGGFPGIPLAAAVPSARFVLAESTQRRAAFLDRSVRALGLANAKVVAARGEEWLRGNAVDAVLVRAGGSLAKLLRTLEPVRRSFRILAAMKGPRWEEETNEARAAGFLRTFPVEAVHEIDLPREGGRRALLLLRGGRRG